jgi:predicted O-linked N-acetylglucosamine transferase (SPINDLY family)
MNDVLFQNAVRAHQAGNLSEAARLYADILRLNPGHFPALFSLGYLNYQTGRFVEADRLLSDALRLSPASAEALFARGLVLQQLDRAGDALACFNRALAQRPNLNEAQMARAMALMSLGRHDQALEGIDLVLTLDAKNAVAWDRRGRILQALGRSEEALAAFGQSAAHDPNLTDALLDRASLLAGLKHYSDAAEGVASALSLNAELPYARGHLCLYRLTACDWRHFEADKAAIAAGLAAGKRVSDPFINLLISPSPAEQLQCARLWMMHEAPPSAAPLWRGECYRHERIRIAYVSSDFQSHATAALMAGVFEAHDRRRFETIAISLGPDDKSTMRGRLASAFDRFLDMRGRSDAEIAQAMRQMEIDIAVDLKGYTQNKRPRIFAFRPAPIQVSYLGYPGTMSAPYIDYLLADRIVIPDEHRGYYSEQIAFLPDSYQCNDSKRLLTVGPPTRADAGLPENGFVFCCFNNNFKITPALFAIWMRLLRNIENSVLWVLQDNSEAIGNLRSEAEAAGVSGSRIVAAPRVNAAEHLARHALADLFLDTQPYGAHTTASDALWMGLPVLTVLGPTFASRVAASLLHTMDVPELVTRSLKEYEAAASRFAREPRYLAATKTKLAAKRDTTPLFDTARFTRNLETAFATMWGRWQRGDAPADFAVNDTRADGPSNVPQAAVVAFLRASALAQASQFNEALAEYDRAIAIAPQFIEAMCNRGSVLLILKRYTEALQSLDAALRIKPTLFEALNNRGNVLSETRRFDEAVESYERALKSRPDAFEPQLNRSSALLAARRCGEALTGYEKALSSRPNDVKAQKGRANALFELGRFEEAIAGFESALRREPAFPYALGDFVYSKLQCCHWRNLKEERARIVPAIRRGEPVMGPLAFLALSDSPEEQRACAAIWAREKFPPEPEPLWRGETYNHDRLRIAYLSADFQQHAVGQAIVGVLEHHDRARFEIIGLSWGPDDQSELRARLRGATSHFIDVSGQTDQDVTRLIRHMEIDIAVDLMGFTADHRTKILAARPAPVQVNYLGYAGTMSAPYMDYIIADATVIPDEARAHYTETVVPLSGSYMPLDGRRVVQEPMPRSFAGLPDDAFVFACFNTAYKLSPEIFDIWMSLLEKKERSVLWLSRANAAVMRNLAREAQSRGIDPSRLIFSQFLTNPADHLSRLACADLFLDTLPYNAHVTATDALLAGVPVLTCKGRSFAGRVGASLLHAAGLPELVAASLDDYQAFALELANNPSKLAELKGKLAANRQTHPLFDTAGYTRQLEQKFIGMRARARPTF